MDRLVCRISGYICYDTNGVSHHIEILRKLERGTFHRPNVYRCPNAVLHPERQGATGDVLSFRLRDRSGRS